jgi:hypothetical protein
MKTPTRSIHQTASRFYEPQFAFLSALIALPFAIMALVLVATVSGAHVWLLRFAGVFLFGVVVAHAFPLRALSSKSQVVIYIILAITASWGFGAFYYFAEINDPFRGEGEMFSDAPFQLAFFLSILPLVRAFIRLTLMKSQVLTTR